MYIVWYTKSLSDISPVAKIHLSKDGKYTLCKKNISENGRWYLIVNESFLKTVNCKKCITHNV